MGKFHGNIGFAEQQKTAAGVFEEQIVEREYYGDVISAFYNTKNSSDTINDELGINNRISVVANEYALKNFQFMKYVVYMGVKWKITNIEPQYPRLILSIGGVYNA